MIEAVQNKMVAPTVTPRDEAQKVASQFEAIFVQQIVSKMREGANVMGGSSMFGDGPGADTYASWFDTYMSEHLAGTGRVGVADSLMRHFEDLGQIGPAADAAANTDEGEGNAIAVDRIV